MSGFFISAARSAASVLSPCFAKRLFQPALADRRLQRVFTASIRGMGGLRVRDLGNGGAQRRPLPGFFGADVPFVLADFGFGAFALAARMGVAGRAPGRARRDAIEGAKK